MAAKKSASKKSPAKAPDAIALLKEDHEKVRGLLAKFEKANAGPQRDKLAAQITRELKVHTTIEEEIFYPAFRDAAAKKDDKKLYFEAKEEHHVVDLVLPEVSDGAANEELKAKAKVLKELVEHHADEEEKEMFPRAKKVLGRDELRELGARLQERKKQLMAAGE